MRGLPVMFYDGSQLDAINGITFRGHSIPEFCRTAQKAPRGEEPLPEVMFYLLLTGRYPTDQEFKEISEEWRQRGQLTDAQKNFILSLPTDFHPMTLLSMAVLYLQRESKFFKAYQSGVNKAKYWEAYYEDSMDLIAKLPEICAIIYRHKYKYSELIDSNPQLDWAGNFAHMLGYESHGMMECLRGYLSIHADHEGGNVSAHTCHLVGSALADPYLSYSAAMNGLAGPLHGLANQECLKWLTELKEFHKGERPNREKIQEFVNKTLGEGRVIPGYGHAVLRNTDPRFMHLKGFADKHIKNDYIADLARECFNTIPGILGQIGKIKNPFPNVDAFSGVCLQHYGKSSFIQVWLRMSSTQLCSLFQEPSVSSPTASGPELMACPLRDLTVSISFTSKISNDLSFIRLSAICCI